MAAIIVSASLVVAPALESTKTTTETSTATTVVTATSVSTTTALQVTVTDRTNFTSTIRSTTTATVSSIPSSPCNAFVWNESFPDGPGQNGVPVLLMRPNSTGYVCVTYQMAFNSGSFSLSNPFQVFPFPVGGLCSRVNGVTSCDTSNSHSFQNSAIPDYITLPGSMQFFTVVYVVKALNNATGFYNYGEVGIGCGGNPMAVGYSASQVNASDFALPPIFHGCPAEPFWPFSEYVTGMNVTYINRPQP